MPSHNYPIVLLYHQISDSAHSLINHYNINVHPKTFELHITTIKRHFAPISMEEFEYSSRNNIDIRKRVLITFDDGYKAAVNNAGGILKRYNLDSIWFINSAFCDNERVFWLSKLMWISGEGLLEEFVRKADLRYPGLLSPLDKPNINSWAKCNYSRILAYLIDEFVLYFGFNENKTAERANLFASYKDIKALSAFAHIGNHTLSHPNVRNITLSDFSKEVEDCYRELRDNLVKAAKYFAFPFGQMGYHWTPGHTDILKGLGYLRIFSVVNNDHIKTDRSFKNIIPRYEVPCDIASGSGLREFLYQVSPS